VNFLYDDIVHILQNRIDSCINSDIDRPGGYVLERMFTKFSSRSFKVTDFGTNRELIYDFLLVINTNLPPVLHRFQVMADYSKILPSERGESHFNAIAWGDCLPILPYIVKNYILWPTLLPQKVSVYLQPLLRNPPRKLPNSVKLSSC